MIDEALDPFVKKLRAEHRPSHNYEDLGMESEIVAKDVITNGSSVPVDPTTLFVIISMINFNTFRHHDPVSGERRGTVDPCDSDGSLAFGLSGMTGYRPILTNSTSLFSNTVKLINSYITDQLELNPPQYSSLLIFNCSRIHKDHLYKISQAPFWVLGIGQFGGGRLWVPEPHGPVECFHQGEIVAGNYFKTNNRIISIKQDVPVYDTDRIVGKRFLIVAYTSPALVDLTEADRMYLTNLGFPLPPVPFDPRKCHCPAFISGLGERAPVPDHFLQRLLSNPNTMCVAHRVKHKSYHCEQCIISESWYRGRIPDHFYNNTAWWTEGPTPCVANKTPYLQKFRLPGTKEPETTEERFEVKHYGVLKSERFTPYAMRPPPTVEITDDGAKLIPPPKSVPLVPTCPCPGYIENMGVQHSVPDSFKHRYSQTELLDLVSCPYHGGPATGDMEMRCVNCALVMSQKHGRIPDHLYGDRAWWGDHHEDRSSATSRRSY